MGADVDGRRDLYSLSCVLYEMLVGERPFTGPKVQAVIAKRFAQTPADVTALREGVPRLVARALQQALQRTPMDRPETMLDFLATLRETELMAANPTTVPPPQSIAVLPFENLSNDRENAYFGDGIAEDVIGALTRVAGLHVAAKTSAFSFKDKGAALTTIGEKLNVATVLQGSVRRAGNRVRIAVQLVSVVDGYHLWSERYDRKLTDVFVVEDNIAGAIASCLELTLVPPKTMVEQASPEQVQAYDLIAEGRAHLRKRGSAIRHGVRVLAALAARRELYAVEPRRSIGFQGL